MLIYSDSSKPFLIQTDDSDVTIGEILSQIEDDGLERLVAYESRTLNNAEQNYSVTERECLVVVHVLKV